MGKFTLRGGPELDERVEQDLATITERVRGIPESKDFLGLVLLGGYGRGEGTPLIQNGRELPFNDYDLIVVGKGMPDWRRRKLQQRLSGMEPELSGLVNLPVDLYLYSFNSLHRAEPSLLNTELKHGHRVLWGSDKLLALMPNYSFDDVPLIEGTRLMMNRGVLLQYLKDRYSKLSDLTGEDRLEAVKYLQKNYLAFGDCLLMMEGTYCLEYQQKRELIWQIQRGADCPKLEWIQQRYLEAIEFKEWGDPLKYDHQDLDARWEECREVWLSFLLWFESRRLGEPVNSLTSYVHGLQGFQDDQTPLWKVVLLNLYLFRSKAVRPGFSWLSVHPRNRVFAALWASMAEELETPLAADLLGMEGTNDERRKRLFQLRSRLS